MATDRNKFIDDLIDAGADDDEISEALQLAESRNEFDGPSKESELPKPQEKTGYLSGINQAMDDKAMEYAQKNFKDEKYPLQHAVQKFNSIVDIPLAGLGKAVEPITKPFAPIGKKLLDDFTYSGGEVEGSFNKNMEKLAPTIQKYKEFEAKHPVFDAATDFIGDVGQLAGNVAGIGGAAKLGTTLGKEAIKAPAKVGSVLEAPGKQFKLGDMKIKDSIAKKGYGKDLIDKKQNIANTIYDYGLTHGGNKGGYEKAGSIINDIHETADNITMQLASNSNTKLVNPIKTITSKLDIQSLPAGKRKRAQAIADEIVADLIDDGLDGDLTIDKLIQAKRSIDTKGLFSNGPGLSGDDILDNAVRKKMYLSLTDEIADISPELKALNTEAKKLYDAQEALGAAASRISNKDAISLSDWVFGAGVLSNPSALPLLAVKKGLAGGRGSDLILNTARTLQGKKVKTVDDILAGVVKPEPQLKQPITDKRRLLPHQMLGEQDAPRMVGKYSADYEIPIGAKIRNLGESGEKITDNLAGGRYALPSPEEIKALYPDLSDEDVKTMLFKFNDQRALPAPMLGGSVNIQKPLPSMGDRIRSLGESGAPEFDKPIVERIALPSPEDIKKLYPSLSDEDARKLIYQLNEGRLLPAPMIETNSPAQTFQRQIPTLGQRLGSIGDLKGKKLSEVPFKIIKKN